MQSEVKLKQLTSATQKDLKSKIIEKNAEVEDAVYLTGLPALGADVVKFVNLLANGGKEFDAPEGESTGEA